MVYVWRVFHTYLRLRLLLFIGIFYMNGKIVVRLNPKFQLFLDKDVELSFRNRL